MVNSVGKQQKVDNSAWNEEKKGQVRAPKLASALLFNGCCAKTFLSSAYSPWCVIGDVQEDLLFSGGWLLFLVVCGVFFP